ncbi:hypothetical protein ACIOUE_00735 [Streptomyces xanthochromogenes]|uniref:hypothetical protein n=1 Tax=Streptomyces xanthochromogenes TaxID=67384 RepID=UPI0037F6362D
MTLQQLSELRLRLHPGGLWMTDPVAAADARTSQADLRIAYAAARGHDLNLVDPGLGWEQP